MKPVTAIPVHSPWVFQYLEDLLDKKINDVALTCLEAFVDCLLLWIYCPYHALFDAKYQYQEKQHRQKIENQTKARQEAYAQKLQSPEFLNAKNSLAGDINISEEILEKLTEIIPKMIKEDDVSKIDIDTKEILFSRFGRQSDLFFIKSLEGVSNICFRISKDPLFLENFLNQMVDRLIFEKDNLNYKIFHAKIIKINYSEGDAVKTVDVLIEEYPQK